MAQMAMAAHRRGAQGGHRAYRRRLAETGTGVLLRSTENMPKPVSYLICIGHVPFSRELQGFPYTG